jgi:penicillin-binding protein 1A
VAGKTGTAENSVDAWFCGYVVQLATCVWVGYPKAEIPMDDVEGVAGVTGGSLPASIWHAFMTQATAKMHILSFHEPSLGGHYVSAPSTSGGYTYTPTPTTTTTTTATTPSQPAPRPVTEHTPKPKPAPKPTPPPAPAPPPVTTPAPAPPPTEPAPPAAGAVALAVGDRVV